LGRLDKALTQLQVVASLDAETMLLAQIFRPVIACELLRGEVFSGKRTALIFGEPTEWIGLLVQAAVSLAEGQLKAAAELRNRAFDAAPATAGNVTAKRLNGLPTRIRVGSVVELILEESITGFHSAASRESISRNPPTCGLGLVPAHLPGPMAARSAAISRPLSGHRKIGRHTLRLARRTVWTEASPDCCLGLGQRMLATEAGEYPLLECRRIELTPA